MKVARIGSSVSTGLGFGDEDELEKGLRMASAVTGSIVATATSIAATTTSVLSSLSTQQTPTWIVPEKEPVTLSSTLKTVLSSTMLNVEESEHVSIAEAHSSIVEVSENGFVTVTEDILEPTRTVNTDSASDTAVHDEL